MIAKSIDPDTAFIQECPEYRPIQTLGRPAAEYGAPKRRTDYDVINDLITGGGEEIACDSCIHFNRGKCGAFNRKTHGA